MTLTPVPTFVDLDTDEPRRYRSLFDAAPFGQLLVDRGGRILESNSRAAALLGGSVEDLQGRRMPDFMPADRARRLRAYLAHGRSEPEEWEVRIRPLQGEPFEASCTLAAVPPPGPSASAFLCVLRDITPGKQARVKRAEEARRHGSVHRHLRQERDHLRALAARYLDAREEDARRIAHELRADVTQIIGAAQLAIDETVRELPPSLRERSLWVKALLDSLDNRLRRISHELRPTLLDEVGLGPALGFLAEDFSTRARVPVSVEGDLGGVRLHPSAETSLYGIVQEALANTARHAQARRVWIRFQRRKKSLRCSVRDDGVGFDPEAVRRGKPAGLGLVGMRERLESLGGRLDIASTPGAGTEIVATVSLRKRP
jgi:PAS domain S-box-containing protein